MSKDKIIVNQHPGNMEDKMIITKHMHLLEQIRDDLRMRAENGVVNISNFLWEEINKIVEDGGIKDLSPPGR